MAAFFRTSPRLSLCMSLTLACVSVGVASTAGCSLEEGADITPRSGNWTYTETSTISNTCNADTTLANPTLSTFLLDYDEGDTFQIENGTDDIECDIDGVDFTCANYILASETIQGFDATITFTVRYEGTLSSETMATGEELVSVTCAGEDCNLVGDAVPCATNTAFEVEFLN